MLTPFENCAPGRFTFWMPPQGYTVAVGPEQIAVPLPALPLPLHRAEATGETPGDAAIGQGVYDYLRQFPDCQGNRTYAALLRDAYPHFLTDLASYAVMVDAKQVEPAYVLRKLNCLKVLSLLEPDNTELLLQLSRGFLAVALEFSELAYCRRHLRDAMRYGQEALRVEPASAGALSVLAEIDLLFGDTPGAIDKWRRLAGLIGDPVLQARIDEQVAALAEGEIPDSCLVDDLEALAEAMQLHTRGDHAQAVYILEQIQEAGRLTAKLPSADFYWLLGVCRRADGDVGGAYSALLKATELEPGHAAAIDALASL